MYWLQCLPGLSLDQSGQDGILKVTEATAVPNPLSTRSSTVLLAASAGVEITFPGPTSPRCCKDAGKESLNSPKPSQRAQTNKV